MTSNTKGKAQSRYRHQLKVQASDHWDAWCGAKVRNSTPDDQAGLPDCLSCVRARRNADRYSGAMPPGDALNDLVWEHCKPRPDGCWEWIGDKDNRGRPKIKRNGRSWFATRWIYALLHNGINDKIFVVHSCNNPNCRNCVNPDHLVANDLPELAGHISARVVQGLLLRFRNVAEPVGIKSGQM